MRLTPFPPVTGPLTLGVRTSIESSRKSSPHAAASSARMRNAAARPRSCRLMVHRLCLWVLGSADTATASMTPRLRRLAPPAGRVLRDHRDHAAVDEHVAAGHVRSSIGGQEGDDARHLLW